MHSGNNGRGGSGGGSGSSGSGSGFRPVEFTNQPPAGVHRPVALRPTAVRPTAAGAAGAPVRLPPFSSLIGGASASGATSGAPHNGPLPSIHSLLGTASASGAAHLAPMPVTGGSHTPPSTAAAGAGAGAMAPGPFMGPTGQLRAHSPGGTLYERNPSPSGRRASRRHAAGYDNPAHSHGNMLPIWAAHALSPIPEGSVTQQRRHLMRSERHFSTQSPGGTRTEDIQGHSQGVLGHLPDASSHWNSVGHRQTRLENQQHNRETSTYHGIESSERSAASGHLAAGYLSPTPYRGSHPSHWRADLARPDVPWSTWTPVAASASTSAVRAQTVLGSIPGAGHASGAAPTASGAGGSGFGTLPHPGFGGSHPGAGFGHGGGGGGAAPVHATFPALPSAARPGGASVGTTTSSSHGAAGAGGGAAPNSDSRKRPRSPSNHF
ncbi:MAG TPA: hypothetical protein VIM98_10995 [Dyella sp.]|uniref:hypothetical protein n=1 Tax=Dyella sp. TaxID=1869338 RepID=UPI002F95E1A9